ncbi:MAG: 3-hydroxyacyl-CoA dehydrogenase family protein [Planctomycetaceae bacterium]|nr:3-hydroxyacyl-CoA dehydrogenase family protein [Planctomycetaceae bacterium]
MAFTLSNRTISKVGVIGSGQIGPDIALYFTKVLAPFGVPIVVVDISDQALAAGKKKVEKKVQKGVEAQAFKPDQAEAMLKNLTFTSDYEALSGASLVVEAATEDEKIKRKIMAQLESVLAKDAIIASNSSHMEPEVIFAETKNPERTLVVHYFFPAERNIMVEVVPGKQTAKAVADWTMKFYENIGKVPIKIGSRYGYAIDPIFEGIFYVAAMGVEAGWGSVKQVDEMAKKALGLGVGPFTAMNLTGGNPISNHGLDQYTTKINSWWRSPKILKDQLAKNAPWETAGRDEKVEYTPEQYKKVADFMTGAYFGIVCEILDSGISNVGDLDMGVSTALVMKPPFTSMNELGVKESLRLVESYAKTQKNFHVSESLKKQAATGKPWTIPVVFREDRDGVALITIRRPAVLA